MDDLILSRLLTDKAYYTVHFMDLALWEPSVRSVCERHGFACKRVKPGISGSFPTFIIELEAGFTQSDSGMIVVKFFGALFEGTGSFGIERAMGHYLARQFLPIRSPAIVAEGELTLGWQYLIFDGIPGVSIGQVRQQLSERSLVEAAGQMGVFMNSLHSVTATGLPIIPMPGGEMTWSGFVDFLKTQSENCHTNHEGWSDLPPQVLDQVQDYLLPVGELLDFASPPHLIHADLTGDHLLGRVLVGADWDSLAIIDWGDARVGNILYELVALHIDLFQADKSLLYSCLKNYRLPDFYKQDFAHKALCMVLLHQFPMPAQIYAPHGGVKTLPELADRLFGI